MQNIVEKIKGFIDYFMSRKDKNTYGGPFNNQKIRQEIFKDLMTTINFVDIFETGTYNGNTTEYMHKTSLLPTITVEINARRYAFAKARLLKYPGIKVCFGNSSKMLRKICSNKRIKNKPVFIYLDAHRNGKLPLLEEIQIIFENLEKAVIMIDDFKVPGFPGYIYDTYKSGESLELKYFSELTLEGIKYYFPSTDPKFETGKKRGSVVIANNPFLIEKLSSIKKLQLYDLNN
ncbi:MAG: hypothetical protein U9R19_17640 [Bacteroidota bacterium]|nr:hypothetical protein [Bacteroidota bacterium]